jgi:DMSO reductase iron-sulfur subunit
MTQYGFYYDATRCTGCKTCELACKDYHNLLTDISFRRVYELEGGKGFTQDANGCWMVDSYTYYTSTSCQHCDNPACMQVCPTGAMHKDENGIVSVDTQKCIGCGYCALACPYKAPKVDREAGHSGKCDGCKGRLAEGKQPICVEACSGRALVFAPIDELPKSERANIAPLPDPSYTNPNLYIKACSQSKPAGSTELMLSNAPEVN